MCPVVKLPRKALTGPVESVLSARNDAVRSRFALVKEITCTSVFGLVTVEEVVAEGVVVFGVADGRTAAAAAVAGAANVPLPGSLEGPGPQVSVALFLFFHWSSYHVNGY